MSSDSDIRPAWTAVAKSKKVTTKPQQVTLEDRTWALLRLTDDGPAVLLPDACPHRLVPLSAATVIDGRLRCPYHGWEFGVGGACEVVPSLGPDANVPPRAHLDPVPHLIERDGTVWVRTDELAVDVPEAGPSLDNLDERLLHAWHIVALADEVGATPYTATLLDRQYVLTRDADGSVSVEPTVYDVTERWGSVWIAPLEPFAPIFEEPDLEDSAFVGAWLPPAVTNSPAGLVADNFLDAAHFPFVHTGTFGADSDKVIEACEVETEIHGFRSIQEQAFNNPEDPGVAAGIRPLQQTRRATYVFRAPFQLLLRLEELDAGAVKTILFFAQPETLTSTRVYTKMLLHGIGGVERPDADTVAREVAFEEAVLAEDLVLQRLMPNTVLPLNPRDELHVRADRLAVALRRELARYLNYVEEVA
jgi:phenylpropionate dioxygenase-like ring-hydroxylating dioxygenase large terminal subunit